MGSVAHDAAALEVWSSVLARARSELPDTTIVMWFSDVQPVELADEILTLSVPSALVRERLQHNHLSLIEDAAANVLGHQVKIEFRVEEGMRHPLGDAPEPMPRPVAEVTTPPARSPAAL